jgi:hypothetical protein
MGEVKKDVMNFTEWLKFLTNNRIRKHGLLPRAVCADGFSVSIQADFDKYCRPRVSLVDLSGYEAFELGYPSSDDELISEFIEYGGSSVYGFVPEGVVEQLVDKHGGIVVMGEVSNSERNIYLGRSAEWLINHAVAEYKFNNIGLVSENPEDDGKSVRVWENDLGYCGNEIGVFDYTDDLGDIPPGAVPTILRVSNALDIPLGTMVPRQGEDDG